MARMHPSKIVAVTLLAPILALGWVAGTVAQSGQAMVTITGVDSHAFPRVTVAVAISDENGPRDGLTAADFGVSEDGVQVPATSITLESDVTQETYLVLALDLSMKAESLARLKEAAKAFIDTLGPRDRVAIVAFYDEVRVVRDLTNNQEVLRAALDSLTAQGYCTAFNDAALEAVTRVGELTAGRKMVVLLTNSADYVSTHTTKEVIAQARSSHTPIYVIGFGDLINPDDLEDIAKATGGRSFILSSLDQIEDRFQTIGSYLRQGGYRVAFRSGLKADGAEHDLAIGVTYQGQEGRAEGHFVAIPGQVTVSLPNLAEGQTVEGVVDLAVEATAPAPIASVAYRLDGRPLAEVTTPPYSFEWDSSTLEPGPYRLTVQVVDQAGNQGQAGVNLNVVRGLRVTASSSRAEVEVGDRVTVMAEVEALAEAEVVRVECLLDGKSVGSDDRPPYRFSFDSDAYAVGQHLITVRAEDSLGREAETSLTLRLLVPSGPRPLWLRLVEQFRLGGRHRWLVIGGVVAAALAVVAVLAIGWMIIARLQKGWRRKIFRLEISNLGNVGSRYELWAKDPLGGLAFQFTRRGARLPQRPGPQVPGVATETVPEVAIAPPGPSRPPAGPARGGVGGAAGQAMRTGSAITDTISSVAAILPTSVGAPLQRAVRPVYRARSTASRAARLPSQVTRAMPASSPARSTAQAARPQTAPVPPAYHPSGETWVQTPFVAPGGTLKLDLIVTPLDPYQAGHYSFKVSSRAVEQGDSPLMVEEGGLRVVGTSRFRRLLPYFGFTAVAMAMVMWAAVTLLTWAF